jgi:hypothetical protein
MTLKELLSKFGCGCDEVTGAKARRTRFFRETGLEDLQRNRRSAPRDMPRLFGADGLVDLDGIRKAPLSKREFRLMVWLAYRPSEGWFLATLFREQSAGQVLQLLAIRGLVEKRGCVWHLSALGLVRLLGGGELPSLEHLYRNGDVPSLDAGEGDAALGGSS